MDRDTESIGGLEKPPPPSRELYYLTIIMDIAGIALSLIIGPWFAMAMVLYMAASKAYSWRRLRLKQYPVIGYLTVIIFQGAFTFWLVYYGSTDQPGFEVPWQGMAICAFLIGGFYPLTQIYQHKQDLEDGVQTISYKLGYRGTFVFCALVYIVALTIMAQFFIQHNEWNKLMVVAIFFIPIIVYFIRWYQKVRKNVAEANFRNTMKMNWLAATCTNISFLILLIWRGLE